MKERFNKPTKQWVKCAIWSLIYILFIIWVGNFWWLLLLPFIFDLFITKFIPWDWWQKIENKFLHTVFSWLDAIVFALIAVYFINLYLFQNYQIPSSSLEKSLLVGDFLFVSKASYGPRIPNTPFSMPLMQHSFPWGGKSYCDKPQWEYRRLKGWDSIEHGDIVVFNFPAGDTVPTKVSNPDYYSLCYMEGAKAISRNHARYDNIMPYYYTDDSIPQKIDNQDFYTLAYNLGREEILRKENVYGEVIWRPVDRRENYVKRCVGLPGDELQIIDNVVYINGEREYPHPGIQLNYFVQTDGTPITEQILSKLDIRMQDCLSFPDATNLSLYVGITKDSVAKILDMNPDRPIYRLPLNEATKQVLENFPIVERVAVESLLFSGTDVWPHNADYGWSIYNYGPINIPKRGETLDLTLDNLPIYQQVIINYERNTLKVVDGVIYINNVPTSSYTFKMDYFWMMGDNRHLSADSRSWGFVPEDHIVGRPVRVWLSLDENKGWFNGKIRWNRIGKSAER